VRTRNLINGTCAQLLELGVPLIGRYVQIEQDRDDARIRPRRNIVGRVRAIENGMLLLDDNLEGFDQVSAAETFLEARGEIFEDCIRTILGSAAETLISGADETAANLHSGPGRKRQIEEALVYLRDKAGLEAVPGTKIKIGQLLSSGDNDFSANEVMPKPVLVFDPSGSRKDDWAERGLKSSGPYDQRTFSPKKLHIAVICQAKHEGQVDRFVAKFLDGMPDVLTGRFPRYGDGFLRRFQLDKPNVKFFTTPTASVEGYLEASRQALQVAADEGFKWNLALVQIEEEFKRFGSESNPYYATKSVLLKRDIAVQSVRLETMAQPASNWSFR
jgi:hypothetical protein